MESSEYTFDSSIIKEMKSIDGFPKGKIEDLIGLSNPPNFTIFPNPFVKIIQKSISNQEEHKNQPFIGNIREGKNDIIYNAYSYHTKVPYKAIMRFILHYTKPGDVIFDGFCGSGMTGVAAQMCGTPDNEYMKKVEKEQPYIKWGRRKAILSDLSPAATFIAYNYNIPIDPTKIVPFTDNLIKEVQEECEWMYETNHSSNAIDTRTGRKSSSLEDSGAIGTIQYTIWSDILICPYCDNEFIYWDVAVIRDQKKVLKTFRCLHCNAKLNKNNCKPAKIIKYDSSIRKEITQIKQEPVLINYSIGKRRFEKELDRNDLETLRKIDGSEIPYWYPTDLMMGVGDKWGDTWRKGVHFGITHAHHFYLKRSLWLLSLINSKIEDSRFKIISLILLTNCSKMSRFGSRTGNVSGTLYIPSLKKELNVIEYLKRKLFGAKGILKPNEKLFKHISIKDSNNHKNLSNFLNNSAINKTLQKNDPFDSVVISTQSTTSLDQIEDNYIDYIFTDPPFGENLMYSELSFIYESWLKVFTNNNSEAIISGSQEKRLIEYKNLMTKCFCEMYRILKPSHWITVEFHNSKASVWNAIQESMIRAGFLIAQVSILNKKQDTFKQATSPGAVKNDLIINAYKPSHEFLSHFLQNAGENSEVHFVKQQLEHLSISPNIERTERMLFSKLLAFYIEKGYRISFDANQFHQILKDNFNFVDGYWFLDWQLIHYKKWKKGLTHQEIQTHLERFLVQTIHDEKSAFLWLYNFLDHKKSFSEIHPHYQKMVIKSNDEIPELKDLLKIYFIKEGNKFRRPLTNKEELLIQKSKENDLQRAFKDIEKNITQLKRKIKTVRKEALYYGFLQYYNQGKYKDILSLASRLNKSILDENSDINDFIEISRIKTSGENELN